MWIATKHERSVVILQTLEGWYPQFGIVDDFEPPARILAAKLKVGQAAVILVRPNATRRGDR